MGLVEEDPVDRLAFPSRRVVAVRAVKEPHRTRAERALRPARRL
ncbi:hypothetical protein P6B95_00525 [Streptomyces atratus]|nr:hypothetical protein [Streptomyces atratus]WPW26110.1 hypothetical protein P6B95_00525 [Streptomyces atratus]